MKKFLILIWLLVAAYGIVLAIGDMTDFNYEPFGTVQAVATPILPTTQ